MCVCVRVCVHTGMRIVYARHRAVYVSSDVVAADLY